MEHRVLGRTGVSVSELADQAGMSMIEMAIAFVLRHPAVTAAIIGPRTMEHLESQLAAADIELPDDVLDRIDEIVPPGTTINPADSGWVSPARPCSQRHGAGSRNGAPRKTPPAHTARGSEVRLRQIANAS